MQRQKLKKTNPNISLPSINMSIDSKRSLDNFKDIKNTPNNEKTPRK